MTKPVVTLLPCGTRYRHQKGLWADEYQLERLDGWIAFYRRMAKKRPQNYSEDVKALLMFKTLEVSK